METHTTNHESILRLPEVKRRTGLSRSSIYAYMKRGLFPASHLISERSIGWAERDITAWVQSRITKNSNAG